MKKAFSILMAVITILIMTGPVTQNQPAGAAASPPTTDWSTWNITHANATSSSIKITSSVSWTATTTVDWVTISPKTGNSGTTTGTVTIAPNPTTSKRTGYIYYYNSGGGKTITINQPAGSAVIKASPPTTDWSTWNITHANATSSSIKITSSASWTASSTVSWIAINLKSGSSGATTGTVTITANSTTGKRTGYIYIDNSGGRKTITINQPAGAASVPGGEYYWNRNYTVLQQDNYGSVRGYTMSGNGCAPSSLANAIQYYTAIRGRSKSVNPATVFDKVISRGYFGGGGTSIWGMLADSVIQNEFGFTVKIVNSSSSGAYRYDYKAMTNGKSEAIKRLKDGAVFIVSAQNSFYYPSGSSGSYHVVAIAGYSSATNKVLILDSKNRTSNYGYGGALNRPNLVDFDTLWSRTTCMYEVIPK